MFRFVMRAPWNWNCHQTICCRMSWHDVLGWPGPFVGIPCHKRYIWTICQQNYICGRSAPVHLVNTQALCVTTSMSQVNSDHHHVLPQIPILYLYTSSSILSVQPMYWLYCPTTNGLLMLVSLFSDCEYHWKLDTCSAAWPVDASVTTPLSTQQVKIIPLLDPQVRKV